MPQSHSQLPASQIPVQEFLSVTLMQIRTDDLHSWTGNYNILCLLCLTYVAFIKHSACK